MKRAVFFDRDGTLNEEKDYLASPEGLTMLDGAVDAVKTVNAAALMAVVITNQSGVGRGYFGHDDVEAVNGRLRALVGEGGGTIDGVYYCPHLPDAGCPCRKPATGLIREASGDLGIDPTRSYVVGDKASDIEMARACGAKGVLVLTGYGKEQRELLTAPPDYIARDVLKAARWIVEDVKSGNEEA